MSGTAQPRSWDDATPDEIRDARIQALEESVQHLKNCVSWALTERIFGLTLLGFPVEQVADYLGVPIERVKAERARCREIAHGTIADVLSEEVWRG